MTALTHTSPQAATSSPQAAASSRQVATSHIRTSRFATLAVGLVAAVSGLAPAASVLLGM